MAKAAGILATISFAGASLWYTVEGAKYAKCQLELAKLEYCKSLGTLPDAGADDKSQEQRCAEILARGAREIMACYIPGDYREWVFRLLRGGWDVQSYSRCGEDLYSRSGPWWHKWGGLYARSDFRPVLWQYPEAYPLAEYLRENGTAVMLATAIALLSLISLLRLLAGGSVKFKDYMLSALVFDLVAIAMNAAWWLLSMEVDQERKFWQHETLSYEEYQRLKKDMKGWMIL